MLFDSREWLQHIKDKGVLDDKKQRRARRSLQALKGFVFFEEKDRFTFNRDTGRLQVFDGAVVARFISLLTGVIMEHTNEMLKETNADVEQSKKILQELANEVRALSDIVNPALEAQVKSLRAHRMTVVQETKEILSAMRDTRAFFLDSNYELEMQRGERFVRLVRDLQALKAEGAFDAICDCLIRLAVREVQQP